MSKAEIERAAIGAAPELAALHGACFQRGWSEKEIASLLHLPGGLAWMGRLGGRPAGLAIIRAIAGEAEVLTIGVTPEARRQGLAGLLLQACEAGAAAAGADRLFLEVSERNQPAIALYDGAGYRETGRRAAYYADGSDARLMEKALSGDGQGAGQAPI